jgi:hypothetical protein
MREVPSAGEDLPTRWELDRKLGLRDLLVLGSCIAASVGPMTASVWLLEKGIQPPRPGQAEPRSVAFMVALCMVMPVAVLVGKYLWLVVMSCFVTKADVAPLISFGTPRRIGHFDRMLLDRLFRR